MSEAVIEAGEVTAPKHVCQWDGCDEPATAGRFGRTYCAPHNERAKLDTQQRRAANRSRTPRPRSNAARLHEDLAKGAKALAMLPLLRNPQVLTNETVVGIIETRADEFAASWVAVAEKDERVAQWLTTLLTGGVWINAGVATLTFTYSIAVFSGLVPLHPAITMVMPEMGQFIVAQPAPPPANTNGDGASSS